MVVQNLKLKQVKTRFIQLIGSPGTGCRRLALSFIQPAKAAVWISSRWNLYAPLLWKIAADRTDGLCAIGLHHSRVQCVYANVFRASCFARVPVMTLTAPFVAP